MSEAPGPSDGGVDFGGPTEETERFGMPAAFPPTQEKTDGSSVKGEHQPGVGVPNNSEGSDQTEPVDTPDATKDQITQEDEGTDISVPPGFEDYRRNDTDIPERSAEAQAEDEKFEAEIIHARSTRKGLDKPEVETTARSNQQDKGENQTPTPPSSQETTADLSSINSHELIERAHNARADARDLRSVYGPEDKRIAGLEIEADKIQTELKLREEALPQPNTESADTSPTIENQSPEQGQTSVVPHQETDLAKSQEVAKIVANKLFQDLRSGEKILRDTSNNTAWRSEEKIAAYEEGESYRIIFKQVGGNETRNLSLPKIQQIADEIAGYSRQEPPQPPTSLPTVEQDSDTEAVRTKSESPAQLESVPIGKQLGKLKPLEQKTLEHLGLTREEFHNKGRRWQYDRLREQRQLGSNEHLRNQDKIRGLHEAQRQARSLLELQTVGDLDRNESQSVNLGRGNMTDETPSSTTSETTEGSDTTREEGSQRIEDNVQREQSQGTEERDKNKEMKPFSPEEEQSFQEKVRRRTQKSFEDPYVRGADIEARYKKLGKKEKNEFSKITSLYIAQKETEGEEIKSDNPLHRALIKYGDPEQEDNFSTAQDTMNALYALKLLRAEGIPNDMDRDIRKLEGKLVDNLQVNESQGLAKLFKKLVPSARAEYAEKNWIGEHVDAEGLLIKGLNSRTENIIQEAEGRDQKPPEPEQTQEQKDLLTFMESLINEEDIDPAKIEQMIPGYIEQAKAAGINESFIKSLEKAAEEFAEDSKSEKLKALLYILLLVGSSLAEMTGRR